MSKQVLEAQPRDVHTVKPKHLRQQGWVPVVVYGAKQEPVALQVQSRNLDTALKNGAGSQLFELQVVGGKSFNVLVRDIQREPIGRAPLHADFYAVNMTEKQHVSIRLVGTGEPDALAGGLMVFQSHESIAIEALPADIPASIEVDLTDLTEDKPIRVADLPAIKGVVYLSDAEDNLFVLTPTQLGEIEEEVEAEDAEPEVLAKGKDDEDDEE
jgi:large subunit ribosomal protein L25